ncbi:MAG: sensor histidine kinase [Bacteroidetes bacterium]|nr:sensor histidine kinase [Bacteroidota bacterium]
MRKYLFILLLTLFNYPVAAQDRFDMLIDSANNYFKKGNYASYLKYEMDALKEADRLNDCNKRCFATLKVAAAHYYLLQRPIALQWMHNARKLAISCNIDSFRWTADRQIGAIYFETSKDDSSMMYLKEAESLLNKTDGNYAERSYLYSIMGETVYRHLHKKTEGKKCYDLAIKYGELSGDTVRMAFANIKQGSYYNSENDCRQAIIYLKRALSLYTAAHLPEGIMYAQNMLGWAYGSCGMAKESFEAMLKQKVLRDSIFRDETARQTAEYETLYKTEKKEKENLLLAKDNAQKQLRIVHEVKAKQQIIIIFIAGLIILTITFLLLYYRYKQKKKEELDERLAIQQKLRFKAVLEAEEKERVRIARELHDSLGQMLSAAKMNMNAMDSYNEEDAKLIENAKKLVDDSVREVRTISHNLMPVSLTEKGIITALNELVIKINDTGLLQVDLIINESEERLNSSVEIAIYRIVQEVINNMIKHSKANKVEILLDYNSDKIYLSIKDNGVGFDTTKIEHSSGIGWKNIFSRVYMMNGDVQVNSQPGRGTLVNIELTK